MKKLFAIALILFFSVSTKAQMNKTFTEFKIGECRYAADSSTGVYDTFSYRRDGGGFLLFDGDIDEGCVVRDFLQRHKREIEEKYGVVFLRIHQCWIEVYDRKFYEDRLEREAMEKKAKEVERQKRLKKVEESLCNELKVESKSTQRVGSRFTYFLFK